MGKEIHGLGLLVVCLSVVYMQAASSLANHYCFKTCKIHIVTIFKTWYLLLSRVILPIKGMRVFHCSSRYTWQFVILFYVAILCQLSGGAMLKLCSCETSFIKQNKTKLKKKGKKIVPDVIE